MPRVHRGEEKQLSLYFGRSKQGTDTSLQQQHLILIQTFKIQNLAPFSNFGAFLTPNHDFHRSLSIS